VKTSIWLKILKHQISNIGNNYLHHACRTLGAGQQYQAHPEKRNCQNQKGRILLSAHRPQKPGPVVDSFFQPVQSEAAEKLQRHRVSHRAEDLPAYFGHWFGATIRDVFTKKILDLKQLGHQFRETILWRLGEEIARKDNLDAGIHDGAKWQALYMSLAERALRDDPKAFTRKYNDLDFMGYAFEDYQIVLSNPIPAKRIIKVLPQGNEFGRVLRIRKQDAHYE
jgi:hypothetical protein